MSGSIEYGRLMYRAMRRVIAEILTEVSGNGLPGKHHFFITYDTTHEAVEIPDWLRERYPEEITIVIQHWYEDLVVDGERGFSVTLNFGDKAVPLFVPFEAIGTFLDPSAEFGLKLGTLVAKDEDEADDDDGEADFDPVEAVQSAGKVISLDSFRK